MLSYHFRYRHCKTILFDLGNAASHHPVSYPQSCYVWSWSDLSDTLDEQADRLRHGETYFILYHLEIDERVCGLTRISSGI